MKTQVKCLRYRGGKASCGTGRSQARVGHGVLYTYAVLIVCMTNIVYVASTISEARAGDGVATAAAIVGEVTASPCESIEKRSGGGTGITAITDAGELYLRADCDVSSTVDPDGMAVSGPPPEWAVDGPQIFDEVIGQPESDPGDRNSHGEGNGNRSGLAGATNPGQGN